MQSRRFGGCVSERLNCRITSVRLFASSNFSSIFFMFVLFLSERNVHWTALCGPVEQLVRLIFLSNLNICGPFDIAIYLRACLVQSFYKRRRGPNYLFHFLPFYRIERRDRCIEIHTRTFIESACMKND